MPQTSIRFFAYLIGVSAIVMFTFRSAFIGNQLWAKCAAAVISAGVGCFVVYFLLFLIANLFSSATATVVDGAVSPRAADQPKTAPSGHAEAESIVPGQQESDRVLATEDGRGSR